MSDQELRSYYLAALGIPQWQQTSSPDSTSSKNSYIPAILSYQEESLTCQRESSTDQKEPLTYQEESLTLQEESSTLKKESSTLKKESSTLQEEPLTFQEESSTLKKESSTLKKESSSATESVSSVEAESSPAIEQHESKPLSSQQIHDQPEAIIQDEPENRQQVSQAKPTISPKTSPESISHDFNAEPLTNRVNDRTDTITQKILECRYCQNRLSGENALSGQWLFYQNADAKTLMLLNDIPLAVEFQKKQFLYGNSLSLMKNILSAFNWHQENIYISSMIRCYSHQQIVADEHEYLHCLSYLREEIELLKPQLVVSLGKNSTHLLSSELNRDSALSECRQKFFNINKLEALQHKTKIYHTFHPSFLLRHPLFKQQAFADWLMIEKYHV